MNWRLLTIGLCLLSGLLIAGVSLTGFVVAVPKEGSFIGFGLVVWSVLLLGMMSGSLEERIKSAKQFGEDLSHGDAIVLDTSAILQYQPEEIRTLLKHYAAYVPDSVKRELNAYVRNIVDQYAHPVAGYMAYRDQAKGILRQTEKMVMAEKVKPLLEARLHGKPLNMNAHEMNDVRNHLGHLIKLARDNKFDVSGNEHEVLEKTLHYINRHCQVSDADVDVLATAMFQATHNRYVTVGERDSDLREAVEFIKQRHPQIGKYIRTVEPYK